MAASSNGAGDNSSSTLTDAEDPIASTDDVSARGPIPAAPTNKVPAIAAEATGKVPALQAEAGPIPEIDSPSTDLRPRLSRPDHAALPARRNSKGGDMPAVDPPRPEQAARRSSRGGDLPAADPGKPRPSRANHPVQEVTTDLRGFRALPRTSKTDTPAQPLGSMDVADASTGPRKQLGDSQLHADTMGGLEQVPRPTPPTSTLKWALIGLAVLLPLTLGGLLLLDAPPPPVAGPPPAVKLAPIAAAPKLEEPPEVAPAPKNDAIYLEVPVDGGNGTLRFEKHEAGVIKLLSTPPTEVTVVKGPHLGMTPVHLTALVGKVDLVLESREAGIYKPVTVHLAPGENPTQYWELKKGFLEIVAPPKSKVSVNGRSVGLAPVKHLSLYEGWHRVEVVLPNKKRGVTKRVEVVPGFTKTHEVQR